MSGAGTAGIPVIGVAKSRFRTATHAVRSCADPRCARRGYEYLAIRPVARNVDAIQRFFDAGFRTLGGHVDLTMDLAERRHRWLDGAHLHGLDFQY